MKKNNKAAAPYFYEHIYILDNKEIRINWYQT